MQPDDVSPPEHLYTWVDVDEHLSFLATRGGWPTWLRSAEAWWDSLELEVTGGTGNSTVKPWLDEIFGAGSTYAADDELMLALDDPRTSEFTGIPVTLRPADLKEPVRRLPLLRDKRITAELAKPLERPEAGFVDDVQVIAFHSFKGGVGRTVHAVAMADAIARRGGNVILVDADLEAPGITWMHRADGGQQDFTYEDFLALLHGSEDGSSSKAVEIAARFLPNQRIGRHTNGTLTVVPTTRRGTFGPPRIEPANLLTPDRSQYFLTDALAELAARSNAKTIIVDLRAGASELSAPILLDPRVQRIFVTTLSHQSLAGTVKLIQQLGRRAPVLQGCDPASSAVITQCRRTIDAAQIDAATEMLASALAETLRPPGDGGNDDTESIDTAILSRPLVSPFHEDLLALPSSWNEVVRVLGSCDIAATMDSIVPTPPPATTPSRTDNDELRGQLHDTAKRLVYADKEGLSSADGFLVTDSLRNLIADHRTEPPLAIVAGAKGAGKTFLFSKTCTAGTWDRFANRAGVNDVRDDLAILPVLEPTNLQGDDPQRLRDTFASKHGGTASNPIEISDLINDGLKDLGQDDARAWRQRWLACIAAAAGIDPGDDPETALTALGRDHRAVFVIDGLEDLFQTLDKDAKKTALRILLTDVIQWLRTLRGRPFGMVVFVRSDFVTSAVAQNAAQLLHRYERYALTWDKEEALRLALWVSGRADVLPDESDISELNSSSLEAKLIPLWGRKMGSENSREARSHMWVPAALGDYHGQVQARDVVLFLSEAARLSQGRSGWEDRILVPTAMRNALLECSNAKIDAVSQEDPDLGALLKKMQSSANQVSVPFALDEVGLTQDEAKVLVELGALSRDGSGGYRVPEIYRHWLGYRSKRRAKVVSSH